MLIVFIIFGMISPLTARFMPEIMKMAFESDPTVTADIAAIFTNLPPPTAIDSWGQFYSNIGQMGLMALVIIFSGMLSSELSRGTLTIILTKGISRTSILLSKATSAALIWTVSLALSFGVCYGYTAHLFEQSPPNILLAVFTMWVFGLFLIALTTLFAALTTRSYICMVLVGAVVVVLNIINIFPLIARYNPASLAEVNMELINQSRMVDEIYPMLAITGICTIALMISAVLVFNKRKL
jgi:ABC-2 type transport system permease protein